MKYILLFEADRIDGGEIIAGGQAMVNTVSMHIEKGYKPLGGISVVKCGEALGCQFNQYTQAMVKE